MYGTNESEFRQLSQALRAGELRTYEFVARVNLRDYVEITKPKQPNFARFQQNGFKQRGRSV